MNKNMVNKKLQAIILEVVDNQIDENTPQETRQTFERLKAEGCSSHEAKKLIGTVVATEIFDVLKEGKAFDETAYIGTLKRLPKLPWGE